MSKLSYEELMECVHVSYSGFKYGMSPEWKFEIDKNLFTKSTCERFIEISFICKRMFGFIGFVLASIYANSLMQLALIMCVVFIIGAVLEKSLSFIKFTPIRIILRLYLFADKLHVILPIIVLVLSFFFLNNWAYIFVYWIVMFVLNTVHSFATGSYEGEIKTNDKIASFVVSAPYKYIANVFRL